MSTETTQAQERDNLIYALRSELLGPRDGPFEIMGENVIPADEYITGQLVCRSDDYEPDPDSESESLDLSDPDETPFPIGNDDENELPEPDTGYNPVSQIKSRHLPRSMGISFIVSGPDPEISVLATFARYSLSDSGWKREPHYYSIPNLKPSTTDSREWIAGENVKLIARCSQSNENNWKVSLFIVNDGELPENTPYEQKSAYFLFQPQIRVCINESTRLNPLGNPHLTGDQNDDEEIQNDTSIYSELSAYARGHLCGATWKDIDYEIGVPDGSKSSYSWTDESAIDDENLIRSFSEPDLRTDYLPIYHSVAPQMNWDSEKYPESPELKASALAEMVDPETLTRNLKPLVTAYRSWIKTKENESDSGPFQSQDSRIIEACSKSAKRIEAGINLLTENQNARLAFCFANKAMATQSEWITPKTPLIWRSFQLGFILTNLVGLTDKQHPDRDICDLLWFPTGGGKTEAYLALAAFILAYRRLNTQESDTDNGGGVAVLSRYTLRLLTIQQFRRASGLITACEYLRCIKTNNDLWGWRPNGIEGEDFLWGKERFSIGLWVGGGVTPNSMNSFDGVSANSRPIRYVGAIEILKGAARGYKGSDSRLKTALGSKDLRGLEAEPAQLTNCPACNCQLSIPSTGLTSGKHILHFTVYAPNAPNNLSEPRSSSDQGLVVNSLEIAPVKGAVTGYKTVTANISTIHNQSIGSEAIDNWFDLHVLPLLGIRARLETARPSRMGYFLIPPPREMKIPGLSEGFFDFEVICPDPDCVLTRTPTRNRVPVPLTDHSQPSDAIKWQSPVPAFQAKYDVQEMVRTPIPVYTIDDQIYSRCPSMIVATVDKFARLPYEPRAGAIFGSVDFYHAVWGYYREGVPKIIGDNTKYRPHPKEIRKWSDLIKNVDGFEPPSLMIQDELHLIEGPLGSMVGAYETAVGKLCEYESSKIKYVASSATVKNAKSQVKSLFDRNLSIFPPPGPRANSNFFSETSESHPSEGGSGRLYVGIACIGKGAISPPIKIWARLLQRIYDDHSSGVPDEVCDPYWTLVGYFNAIRELGKAKALFRQDIPQRMGHIKRDKIRPIDPEDGIELSGRTDSVLLPQLLNNLDIKLPNTGSVAAVMTTSMFGTGVDVSRLGLMVVNGQPNTTSSYIQATGRVGRQAPGLVVTFLKNSRPRDLDHYEFFTGYHRAVHRWVEPVTVAPFSSRARERSFGPIQVALLRQSKVLNGIPIPNFWRVEQRLKRREYFSGAGNMSSERQSPAVNILPVIMETRSRSQPAARRPSQGTSENAAKSELDRWRTVADSLSDPSELVYYEPTTNRSPQKDVVLGDPPHNQRGLKEAFLNAPQSLRDVEATTGIKVVESRNDTKIS